MSKNMTYEEQATIIREIIDRNDDEGINCITDALITYIVETSRFNAEIKAAVECWKEARYMYPHLTWLHGENP